MLDWKMTVAGVALIVVGLVITYALWVGASVVGSRTLETAWFVPVLVVIAGIVVLVLRARR